MIKLDAIPNQFKIGQHFTIKCSLSQQLSASLINVNQFVVEFQIDNITLAQYQILGMYSVYGVCYAMLCMHNGRMNVAILYSK